MVVTGIYVGLSLSAGAATTVDLSFFFYYLGNGWLAAVAVRVGDWRYKETKEKTKRERAKSINIKSIRDERENV